MSKRAAIIAGALIGGLVLLWWFLRGRFDDDEAMEPGAKPPKGLRYDVEELKKLPNYHNAKSSKIRFANHAEFVRTLDQELIKRFPRKAARAMIIAHAATGGGWHLEPRKKNTPALIWYNWWGQTVGSDMIVSGVAFTIMTPRISKEKKAEGVVPIPQAFRAFSSTYESLMEGYIPNIHSYIASYGAKDPVRFLDERGDVLTLAECVEFVTRVKYWFKAAEKTPVGIATKAGKWMWIYNKHIKGNLL